MLKIHYFERLTLGFRMLDDDYGTRDEDEIPIDIDDVTDSLSEEEPTFSYKM